METDAAQSDKGLGLTVVLGALALASAGLVLSAPGTEQAAWGFAGLTVLGSLLVVAIHVYW